MNRDISIKFERNIHNGNFLLFRLDDCPASYLESIKRDEFFEIIWFEKGTASSAAHADYKEHCIYLIPPFRATGIGVDGKEGCLIAFKREYLEEDDKEYALDVFKLFNLQGQYSLITLDEATHNNLRHLYALMAYECQYAPASYLALKSILKVFLFYLIRLNSNAFSGQDINQKRVYEFCMLLDKYYYKEKKSSFYAAKIGITEKRLNQILREKMNKTITQLLHARLVLEATRKISAGEFTIKEISYLLNFEDPSYFSRFFKKQTGCSPEEYKKALSVNFPPAA